jgi:DeoR/GlpR family transcriptional regulator of sugar metabolism
MALMNVVEAAQYLGVSTHTIKRRLKKGELKGEQRATPQGFVWLVEVADEPVESDSAVADDSGAIPTATAESASHFKEIIELLKSDLEERGTQISFLKEELESRRREIQELHVLLQQSQAALPAAGDTRSWWYKLWHRNGR